MAIYIYRIKYFSSIDWRWWETVLIAANDEEVTQYVNKSCPREYRNIPYNGGRQEDSFRIIEKREVTLPLILTENGERVFLG